MQKEIFEQPKAIADTLDAVPAISPDLFGDDAFRIFKEVDAVLILACGTSYYSGSVAKYWARVHRPDPDLGRGRERIPVSGQRAEPAHPGRHHLAERRDRRHAGGAEARPLARSPHADGVQRGQPAPWCRVRHGLHHDAPASMMRRVDQVAFTTQQVGLVS
jgi:hypothetical protein